MGGGSSHAAHILLENNEIVGATGVEIEGELFDLAFKTGSCADVFDGCDQESDFAGPPTTSSTVRALLNQVVLGSIDQGLFTDIFDVNIFGCDDWNASVRLSACRMSIPTSLEPLNATLLGVRTNSVLINQGAVSTRGDFIVSTIPSDGLVFAVFTPSSEVPLPAAAPMLLAGLFGLGGLRRLKAFRS